MPLTFQHRYLALVAEIEREFRVREWRCGDADLWPLARMDLFLDMHWRHTGQVAQPLPPLARRAAALLATPFTNAWKSRNDLKRWTMRPTPADAVVLGDDVSLDLVDGAWQDRFAEPVIAELERRGRSTFVMQPGDLGRLPWRRKTYAANLVDAWSRLAGRARTDPTELPDLEAVHAYLAREGIKAPSLARAALERRARVTLVAADAFERILKTVRPRLAFVTTFYAGLAPAFLLACRRLGILSIDLQHCPQDGGHKAYGWSNVPAEGYGLLPAVFWNWNQADADNINRWASALPQPWHQAIHGGDTQLAGFSGQSAHWQQRFREVAGSAGYAREIIVALQPIAGQAPIWDLLAQAIERAPSDWRWWIRRHPSSPPHQDPAFGRLLSLRRDNVLIEQASTLPLPVLLPHMSTLVSLMSGAAAEAAMFGVPALFLSEEARGPFGGLIERGCARVIDPRQINAEIEALADARPGRSPIAQPSLSETLDRLEEIAADYAALNPARRNPEPRKGNRSQRPGLAPG